MFTHIILDVDGTLTDSSVIYTDDGKETKKFSIRDGVAFAVAKKCNMKIIVITGRECESTTRRMKELGATETIQGVKNKYSFIKEYMKVNKIPKNEIMYVGDDINDYYAMKLVGYVACPQDACDEVKSISNYISTANGGKGAFRDIIEYTLGREKWLEITEQLFG